MKQLRSIFVLIFFVTYVNYGHTVGESRVENGILLKRFRRIIRGHLAVPGQVMDYRFFKI